MKNKALIYFFNKIYNKAELTKLIVNRKTIRKITDYYKRNFESYPDYSSFYMNLGVLSKELEKSKSAMAEYHKQFDRKLALQPAILSECFIVQTLANIFELDEFIDVDENKENVPINLFLKLMRAKGGELEGSNPRYIYYSDKKNIVLVQYGDSSSIDAIFVKDGYRIRLEIKEEKSKLGEYDLNYDEKGKLIATENINLNHPEYKSFIDIFNNTTNVFDYLGKNFKIGSYLDSDLLNKIVEHLFDLKKIDLYILQIKDKIFSVPSEHLLDCVDVNSGSEIRTAGRNAYNVFTPKYLMNLISSNDGTINDDIVSLNYHKENISRARGKDTDSRYKINSLFFVEIKNVTITDKVVYFPFNKIRQNKSTISIHLYVFENKEVLKDVFLKFNS